MGGLRYEYEHFSFKYKSLWSERFVFQSPPQSIYFPLAAIKKTRQIKHQKLKNGSISKHPFSFHKQEAFI